MLLRQKAAAYLHRELPAAPAFGADTDFGDESTGLRERVGRLIVYDRAAGLKHRVIALHSAGNPRLVQAVANSAGTMFQELEAVATLVGAAQPPAPFADRIVVFTDAALATDAELVRAFAQQGLRVEVVFDAGAAAGEHEAAGAVEQH